MFLPARIPPPHWKNTQNVIEWLMKIEEKSKYKFIVLDIKDFYPSIKEALLIKAINFAEKLVNITKEDKVIIKDARKSPLYDNSEPWMKKDSGLFDATMGAYSRQRYASWEEHYFYTNFFSNTTKTTLVFIAMMV